ncbi:MAG: DUF1156 domain-containing protein [Gammaproteobacteria bacterium]|nr:DUF1156 domain-containing protein [Gammaproteobacteria bacterium]
MALNDKRLIEVAFPLRQASIDSVHEKNVRHGHISTLHIWPARRPLAACRAALIATLLPDPGNKEQRDEILKRLGGTLIKTSKKKKLPGGGVKETEAWQTQGGILHWGRESGPELDWFRDEIKKAYGGRAPKVLDPFAGGGAIPLEAMRLGCDVTAADINPVAWFVLKCTLEYPQKLAGQKVKLPDFALEDGEFMGAYLKAMGVKQTRAKRGQTAELWEAPKIDSALLEADLSWHLRAWGRWVLKAARKKLAKFYPTYAEFCSLKPYQRLSVDSGDRLKLVPLNDDGQPQIDLLNAGFDAGYLKNSANPRWVAKPTVAYLWARTVSCKACRAELPLLKTRWLAKKENKRVLLRMQPREDKSGVDFDIETDIPLVGGNAAQRREHDKRISAGTMSRAGATCPCCGTTMTMEDLRMEGRADRRGQLITAVVVESPKSKEYRLPTSLELTQARTANSELLSTFEKLPDGIPSEPIIRFGKQGGSYGFPIITHGFDTWDKLYSPRQLLALGVLAKTVRGLKEELGAYGYSDEWQQALVAYNALLLDKTADYGSSICSWHNSREIIGHTFARFALPMVWDFAELAVVNNVGGAWTAQSDWLCRYVTHALVAAEKGAAKASKRSVLEDADEKVDVIVTDPPYYDAIPYSDLMDFFHIWLRRVLHGLSAEFDSAFANPLSPKWNQATDDGELIDDASRFEGDKQVSKRNYETGMARAFMKCHEALTDDGRLVIVFAHKQADAWETLVSAIIKAGFVVDASWPIQTEMGTRMRAFSSAALSSSVWLVCRKRDPKTRAGWDTQVLKDMQSNITKKLRDFWDAGIRGPDFVWAATGPALEAYSRYPAVKKASESGTLMGVEEFLRQVRRIVVDFVVGRVLTRSAEDDNSEDNLLDDITTYYLLHRSDFLLSDAPSGPCILYMLSCGVSERELTDAHGILAKGTTSGSSNEEDDSGNIEATDSGSKLKLKPWTRRSHKNIGEEKGDGRAPPLIDQLHRVMHLWKAGDVVKVDTYLDRRGLKRNQLFGQLVQALIEQSREEGQNDECAMLERIANHLKLSIGTGQREIALE